MTGSSGVENLLRLTASVHSDIVAAVDTHLQPSLGAVAGPWNCPFCTAYYQCPLPGSPGNLGTQQGLGNSCPAGCHLSVGTSEGSGQCLQRQRLFASSELNACDLRSQTGKMHQLLCLLQAKEIADQLNLTSPTLAESAVSMSALLSAVLLTVAVAAHMHLSPAPAAVRAPQLAFACSSSILAGRKRPQLLKSLQPASLLRCAPSCRHQPRPACYRRQWTQQHVQRQQRTPAPHLPSAWRPCSRLLAHA